MNFDHFFQNTYCIVRDWHLVGWSIIAITSNIRLQLLAPLRPPSRSDVPPSSRDSPHPQALELPRLNVPPLACVIPPRLSQLSRDCRETSIVEQGPLPRQGVDPGPIGEVAIPSHHEEEDSKSEVYEIRPPRILVLQAVCLPLPSPAQPSGAQGTGRKI